VDFYVMVAVNRIRVEANSVIYAAPIWNWNGTRAQNHRFGLGSGFTVQGYRTSFAVYWMNAKFSVLVAAV
jgi:hypothetical protein